MFTVTDKLGRENHYGADGHWFTEAMRDGSETVEEHLRDGHGLSVEQIADMNFDECHAEHDRLHAEANDNEVLAFMEASGFLKLFGA